MKLISIDLAKYKDHPKNPNTHPDDQLDELAKSLDDFSQVKNIVVWRGFYLAGHGLASAAKKKGLKKLKAMDVSKWPEDKAIKFMVSDNRLPEMSMMDDAALKALIDGFEDPLSIPGIDDDFMAMFEQDKRPVHELFKPDGPLEAPKGAGGAIRAAKTVKKTPGALMERFVVPPFTTLDTRQGYWQDRRRAWLALGIKSEIGRAESAKLIEFQGYKREGSFNTVSVFDPVLCELMFRWFVTGGGRILDPFAGGSVRGVVAAWLGYEYHGIDLSSEQIAANLKNWHEIKAGKIKPGGEALFTGDKKTPIQKRGDIWIKRDDLFSVAGVRGGKVRTAQILAKGAKGLVTAGSRKSPQCNIIAHIALSMGVPCRLHVPSGALTPELAAAADMGAEIIQHKPGYNSVIVKRAHDDAKAKGWAEIPFGMECAEAVRQTAGQVFKVPGGVKRIVMPVGSGMSLAGVLQGLKRLRRKPIPVLGVVVGANPEKRLDEFAPEGWRDMVELVDSGIDYHKEAEETALGDILLDPIYEAKCIPFLRPGDLFWIVGIRSTVSQAMEGAIDVGPDPSWVVGDSLNIPKLVRGEFDFIFSCPPYVDLEVYSDDGRDLSVMEYEPFLKMYYGIIDRAVAKLKNNRFACFVVGDVRDKNGFYLNFVNQTIRAFERAGARYYNDGVLINVPGTMPARISKMFEAGRKLGKLHQNVLVFCKGDPQKATAAIRKKMPEGGGSKKAEPGAVWRVSSKWALKKINCTLEGILKGCGGACCKSPTFWPPRSGKNGKGCHYLTSTGCSLAEKDKPIICLLYPFMLNKSDTLCLHGRALLGHCKKNYSKTKGRSIIECMRGNLVELFGEGIYAEMLKSVKAGNDFTFRPPANVIEGMIRDDRWAAENQIPGKRSNYEKP